MNNFQKVLTFLWNSLFFSHREIEENQRRRFKENNPEFKEETKKKFEIKVEERNSKKPSSFLVVSLLILIPVFFILLGSIVVEKYENILGIEIVFLICLAAAGIIPCFLVQKLFYPKDK